MFCFYFYKENISLETIKNKIHYPEIIIFNPLIADLLLSFFLFYLFTRITKNTNKDYVEHCNGRIWKSVVFRMVKNKAMFFAKIRKLFLGMLLVY